METKTRKVLIYLSLYIKVRKENPIPQRIVMYLEYKFSYCKLNYYIEIIYNIDLSDVKNGHSPFVRKKIKIISSFRIILLRNFNFGYTNDNNKILKNKFFFLLLAIKKFKFQDFSKISS